VKAPLEYNHVLPVCNLFGEFYRRLYRLGSAVAEKEGIEVFRHNGKEFFNKAEARGVDDSVHLTEYEPFRLFLHRFYHPGMAMAGACYTDPRGKIDVPGSLFIVEIDSFSPDGIDFGYAAPHVGEIVSIF
jgi:hypothetical protein